MQNPTDQYLELDNAYEFYNARLFEDSPLPPCLITLQRKKGSRGYFAPERFTGRKDNSKVDELALNPDVFDGRTDKDILSTLVHEMVHVWQAHYGKPGRGKYHNKQWADKMEAIGLMPSDTGQAGGKRTGQSMTHYIIEGGLFDTATNALLQDDTVALMWQSAGHNSPQRKAKRASKTKYTCPTCGQNAWAKPDSNLMCGDCVDTMISE